MSIVERARELRSQIETIAQTMDDEEATNYAELFPQWDENTTYSTGQKVRYGDTLYTVLQDHDAQESWTPDAAPSLFSQVLPGQSGTEIGAWTQPDSTNPYSIGDQVTYNGKTYESTIDGNVWSPDAYPAGWKEV
ncbi:MAG: hypothetical protein LIO92_13055 [Clostridiales bacterium]|nr:hypothetical protein [Clostridiales bacterium]